MTLTNKLQTAKEALLNQKSDKDSSQQNERAIADLQVELESAKEKQAELAQQAAANETKLQQAKKEYDDQLTALEASKASEVLELQDQMSQLQQGNQDNSGQLKALQQQLAQKEREALALKEEFESRALEVAAANEERLLTKDAQLSKMKTEGVIELGDLTNKLQTAKEALLNQKSDKDSAQQKESQQNERDIADLQAELTSAKAQQAELVQQAAANETKLQQAKKEYDDQLKALGASKVSELSELQDQISQLQQVNQGDSGQLKALQQQLAQKEQEALALASANEARMVLQGKLEFANQKIAQQAQEIASATLQVSTQGSPHQVVAQEPRETETVIEEDLQLVIDAVKDNGIMVEDTSRKDTLVLFYDKNTNSKQIASVNIDNASFKEKFNVSDSDDNALNPQAVKQYFNLPGEVQGARKVLKSKLSYRTGNFGCPDLPLVQKKDGGYENSGVISIKDNNVHISILGAKKEEPIYFDINPEGIDYSLQIDYTNNEISTKIFDRTFDSANERNEVKFEDLDAKNKNIINAFNVTINLVQPNTQKGVNKFYKAECFIKKQTECYEELKKEDYPSESPFLSSQKRLWNNPTETVRA
jgi:hypothetical protein